MRNTKNFRTINAPLSASLQDIADFDVSSLDVLQLDIENKGSAAVTGFAVLARVSPESPYRDVTPGSVLVESDLVFYPARTAPGTLAQTNWTHLGLNVTAYQNVKLQAVGAGAVIQVGAGGYEVGS